MKIRLHAINMLQRLRDSFDEVHVMTQKLLKLGCVWARKRSKKQQVVRITNGQFHDSVLCFKETSHVNQWKLVILGKRLYICDSLLFYLRTF